MFERFTKHARKVMANATNNARRFGHDRIGTEHIFLAVLMEGDCTAAGILRDRGVNIEKMLAEVEQLFELKNAGQPVQQAARPEETPRAVRCIEYAIEEALALNHDYIGSEHILLGLLRESEGTAAAVLANLGVNIDDVRASLE